MAVVFSGIQPTGNLHLGNFFGAIKPWISEVEKHSSNTFFFSIVDMHAITIFQNPKEFTQSILNTFAIYLACGLKISTNVSIFQQSKVSQHAELGWILSCNTPLGWLDRMTQYKDKTAKNKERECLGLYAYPCLMASDILLYNTNFVPVGEDQKQHVELARDIAIRMNHLYNQNIFTIPEAKISEAKRVMSLKDGTKKMSKSDEAESSRISITEENEDIAKKIAKATTGNIESAEVKNLLLIYKEVFGKEYQFEGEIKFSAFKSELTAGLISMLSPIREEYKRLTKDRGELCKMLQESSMKVQEVASKNMNRVKSIIGFEYV